jgi:hypothetical protein
MLDDDAIARYARQIVVPGIGASGQEKLLATTVLVAGHARGVAQARLYLEAAGVRVIDNDHDLATANVVLVAGVESLAPSLLASLSSSEKPVCWYVLDADGFTSGVHPDAPLPARAVPPSPAPSELHDAAACDAASLACAIAIGLPHRRHATRWTF